MIYFVSRQQELFTNDLYKQMTVEDSIKEIESWNVIQFDTETTGVDSRIAKVLCAQFGNKQADMQIVVDCTTVDLTLYKKPLESKMIVGQNLYFDLQFLYNYGIICRKIFDTMIVEQLLYLGYPSVKDGGPSYSLKAIAERRLHKYIDKTIRSQIATLGLTPSVIVYAAYDVVDLEDIALLQWKECQEKDCVNAARLECSFVPVLAYGSWCGIRIDEQRWKEKMKQDRIKFDAAYSELEKFVASLGRKGLQTQCIQLSLFDDIPAEKLGGLVWPIPGKKTPKGNKEKIIEFIESLGFKLPLNDKGEKTIDQKELKQQKGVNDDFLKVYLAYTEAYKVISTYGVTYLNSINPITGRIHTTFKQLAADTGRIACGNGEEDSEDIKINPDLAKLKGFPTNTKNTFLKCGYPNIQTLPSDEITRQCFVPNKGNSFCSCDWSAIESRLGADIYQEKSMIDEFLYGSGDMHSLVAQKIFDELKNVPVKEIKDKFPHLRKAAKPVEFSQQFGGSAAAIQRSMGCSKEKAEAFAQAYNDGFPGIAKFKEKGSLEVRSKGYILLNPITGHKTYWWDFDKWKKEQDSYNSDFWDRYKPMKAKKLQAISENLPYDTYLSSSEKSVIDGVSRHFRAAAKWDRKALNSVTQGTGAVCFKESGVRFFDWIVDNGYFNIVLIVDFIHDELCEEHPEKMTEVPGVLKNIMESVAAKYCKSVPIPAEPAVGDHWIH